ncbi:MAG TPA: alpha-amylase/4-alpha-glucanotransferase domain-containing protein [Gemmatimonadales bacterium]|nr:alpha-amylase/4-alpha-glucanotransferase domain-containing protein [Gemmatimonadales bacterium]
MTAPIRFAFGLHLHQPVGNFDHVFEQHLEDVYRPLLRQVIGGGLAPATLHLSGPLLDWLLAHDAPYLDELARMVSDGKVELLLGGYDEPILAVLPREDRLEQIGRMRDALRSRFGVDTGGLWLTERVWEPDLAGDLHDAGVRYALVDDRHFLVAGFDRAELHRPWRTEHGGRSLALFPIDETLRYLVPFRPPSEFAEYLGRLRDQGQPLALLADDGEKFGGWPGTREWVYQRGWLRDFLSTLERLREEQVVRLVTCSEALAEVEPAGLAYLPSASYREMEGWALPEPAAIRLAVLERELGEERLRGPDGSLVRGSHWRHFFVKYPESNRMHKKMLALSALCRARGEPAAARRAIGRAQCNDAYWHGVFGGLYLPHLREAVWRELARAEADLRRGEEPAWEGLDLHLDGHPVLWLHSAAWSLVVSPARGGAIEEWTDLAALVNYAAVLTRRREAYHGTSTVNGQRSTGEHEPPGGAPSIHELEKGLELEQLPPVDRETRAILQERVYPAGTTAEALARGDAAPLRSWAAERALWEVRPRADGLEVVLQLPGLEKHLIMHQGGTLEVHLRWERAPEWPGDARLTTELSLFRPLALDAPGAAEWRYPIETVAKSEKGFDRTRQGESLTLAWPAAGGEARFTARP